MADEPNKEPEIENVTVPKTEFEQMQQRLADLKRAEELEAFAKAEGFANLDEYIEGLELAAQAKKNGDPPPPPKKADPPAPVVKVDEPPKDERIDAMAKLQWDGTLRTHFIEYDMLQNRLPEDDRFDFERKELDALINGPARNVIFQLAQDKSSAGNLYLAAANYKLSTQGIGPLKAKVLAAAEAKAKAETTATQDRGGRAADVTTTSYEDARAKYNKEQADKIVPDSRPYKMPDRAAY